MTTFALAALVLIMIPGPDQALITRSALTGGRAGGLLTMVGGVLGLAVHATAAALGLSALLLASATAFTVMKVVGAIYLLWLGIQTLRAAVHSRREASGSQAMAAPRRRRVYLRQGFLSNALNPKVALFFVTFLPQFLATDGPAPWAQALLLSVIFAALYLSSWLRRLRLTGVAVKMKMIVMTLWRAGAVTASALTLAVVSLTGCGTDSSSAAADGKVAVVAAFYPFAFVAQQVGGNDVTVANLTKPGAEPHDLELTPRQVAAISEADLAIYLKGFQPSVDEAIQQNKPAHTLEVSTVVPLSRPAAPDDEGESQDHSDHLSGDPHIWLDPTKLAAIAHAVGDQLAAVDPPHAADFRARAAALVTRLDSLDATLRAGLRNCRQKVFVTSHAAFGYFAQRYGLEQIAIAGLSPEADPGPARIQQIQREVEQRGITTVFFETLVSPDLADTIARDTGATAAVLDPIEGIKDPTREDYFSVMHANLTALRRALGPC